MKIKCELENIVRNIDGTISIYVKGKDKSFNYQNKIIEQLKEIKDKDLNVDIDVWREKRSLDANNYSWKLQDDIAKKMGLSIDEVHEKMVLSYGVLETYSILKEAFESASRMFEYYKVLGESTTNGKTFVHIRAGIGTHHYDTKEMSVFIDGVVQECKNLDIPTLEDYEIEQLVKSWGKQCK